MRDTVCRAGTSANAGDSVTKHLSLSLSLSLCVHVTAAARCTAAAAVVAQSTERMCVSGVAAEGVPVRGDTAAIPRVGVGAGAVSAVIEVVAFIAIGIPVGTALSRTQDTEIPCNPP